jgi:uncharacterized protein YcbK (DUF882 family)
MSRRGLLAGLGAAVLLGAAAPAEAARRRGAAPPPPPLPPPTGIGDGSLTLVNANTRERLSIAFVRRRRYDPAALRRLAHFFRDWREDEARPIDPELFDTLSEAQRRLGGRPLLLTCGFRTAETNRIVGGDPGSLHVVGKAADVAVPGVPVDRLHRTLLDLRVGGVGFYPARRFCHVDVGPVRTWADTDA